MKFNKSNKFTIIYSFFILLSIMAIITSATQLISLPELSNKYDYKAEVNLNSKNYKDYTLNTFIVDKEQRVALTIVTKNIDSRYIDLKMLRSDNSEVKLLHGEKFFTNRYQFTNTYTLDKGEYKLILNSKKSKGKLLSFVKLKSN